MGWQLLLQIILILLNAVFACAEIAVISANEPRLEKMADDGNKRAKRLLKLSKKPSEFLATIQVAITLSGFIGSAFAANNFSEPLASLLQSAGIPLSQSVLKTICVVVITLVLSFFTLVFGELVPKRLAIKNPEKIAMRISGFVLFVSKLFAPLVWILNVSTNGILKLMGIDPDEESENVTEEEILLMSDVGAENGTINEDEHRIIKNVFEFNDINVGQVCTHRTEVSFLDFDDDDEKWLEQIYSYDSRKIPIYQGNIDKIIGILDTKQYWKLGDKSRDVVMKVAVSEPYFVHENMKADVLFDEMKNRNSQQFAIVVDEYGGVNGIVTVTDLVEQLVGDFSVDNKDELEEFIEKTGENQWTASGIIPLSQVAEETNARLPVEEYDTLSDYIMAYAVEFPKDGVVTLIETDTLFAKLTKVHNHRIEQCTITLKETENPEE